MLTMVVSSLLLYASKTWAGRVDVVIRLIINDNCDGLSDLLLFAQFKKYEKHV